MNSMYNFNIKENDFLKRNFKAIDIQQTRSIFEWNKIDIYQSLKSFIEEGVRLFKDNKMTRILSKPYDVFFDEIVFISTSDTTPGAPKASKLSNNPEIQSHGFILKNIFQTIDEDYPQNSHNIFSAKETRKQKKSRGETNRTINQSKMGEVVGSNDRSRRFSSDNNFGKHFTFEPLGIPEKDLKKLFYSQLLKLHVEFAPLVNSKYFKFKSLIDNAGFALYFGLRDKTPQDPKTLHMNMHVTRTRNVSTMLGRQIRENNHEGKSTTRAHNFKISSSNKPSLDFKELRNNVPQRSTLAQYSDSIMASDFKDPNIRTERIPGRSHKATMEARTSWKEDIAKDIHGLLVVDFAKAELEILCIMGFHPEYYKRIIKRAINMLQTQFPDKPIKISLVVDKATNLSELMKKLTTRSFVVAQVAFENNSLIYHMRSEQEHRFYLDPEYKPTPELIKLRSSTKNHFLTATHIINSFSHKINANKNLAPNYAAPSMFYGTSRVNAYSSKNLEIAPKESLMHLSDRLDRSSGEIGSSRKRVPNPPVYNYGPRKLDSVAVFDSRTSNNFVTEQNEKPQSPKIANEHPFVHVTKTEFPFKSVDSHVIRVNLNWTTVITERPSPDYTRIINTSSQKTFVDFQLLSLLAFIKTNPKVSWPSCHGFIWSQLTHQLLYHNLTLDEVQLKHIKQTFLSDPRQLESHDSRSSKDAIWSYFQFAAGKITAVVGSLCQSLRLAHSFYIMVEGRPYLRVSPGRKITRFKGRKFDFELFVIATEAHDTFAYFLDAAAFSEGSSVKNDDEFSKLISEIFQDIDYSSAEQPKSALYIPPFRVELTRYLDSSLFEPNTPQEETKDEKSLDQSDADIRDYVYSQYRLENPNWVSSRLNAVFYDKSISQTPVESMADLESVKEISELSLPTAQRRKSPKRKPNKKPVRHQKEPKALSDKTAAVFKFEVNFSGRLARNGLIYKSSNRCKVLKQKFIFGILHSDVEQLFLHPTFSLLVDSDKASTTIEI
jgi:hypothetical protein